MTLLLLIRCDQPGCLREARALWPLGVYAFRGLGWHVPDEGVRCEPAYCPVHAMAAREAA